MPKFWKVLDRRRLLLLVMEGLAGNAHVSFEGNLRSLNLLSLSNVSQEPTAALKRNTLWPEQDFIVVPLGPAASEKIIAAIGGSVPKAIIHIQIEKDGILQFGAYDGFHPECFYFGPAVTQGMIDSAITEGILRPYTQRPPGSSVLGEGST